LGKVLIEVIGGVAHVVRSPKTVKVEILDLDVFSGGGVEEAIDYWNALSLGSRRHLKRHHPGLLKTVKDLSAGY